MGKPVFDSHRESLRDLRASFLRDHALIDISLAIRSFKNTIFLDIGLLTNFNLPTDYRMNLEKSFKLWVRNILLNLVFNELQKLTQLIEVSENIIF
jgi:hypothetical protein